MKNRTILAMLLTIIIFFIGHRFAYVGTHLMGNLTSCCLYPILRLQHAVIEPVYSWCVKRTTIEMLEKELASVVQERDVLLADLVALQGLRQYTKETRDLLPFNKRYVAEKGIVCQVLVRHMSENAQFILVDGGSRQGVKKDMVALHNNCLIGRVDDVYPWYCKICLITDPACKVAAYCAKTGASGIHQGANKGTTDLSYISHLERIRVGDMVLSNGEGLIFPAGFALGTIQSAQQGDLFYTVVVNPAVDFSSLRYCLLASKEDMR